VVGARAALTAARELATISAARSAPSFAGVFLQHSVVARARQVSPAGCEGWLLSKTDKAGNRQQ
jgi:hypothetical protein